MQLLTHALAGWVGGNAVAATPKERLGCIVVSLFPDVDGLGLLLSSDLYLRWHHVAAHNLLVGIATSAVLMVIGQSRLRIGFLYLALFQLHLGMDLLGSGAGWGIAYFWPFSGENVTSPMSWDFRSWQNYTVLVVLALTTIWIGYTKQRTPLEVVAPSMNSIFIRRD